MEYGQMIKDLYDVGKKAAPLLGLCLLAASASGCKTLDCGVRIGEFDSAPIQALVESYQVIHSE